MWHIDIMEYYSAIKKHEMMPFATTWMDLDVYSFIILNETSQMEKDKHRISHYLNYYDFIINLDI